MFRPIFQENPKFGKKADNFFSRNRKLKNMRTNFPKNLKLRITF